MDIVLYSKPGCCLCDEVKAQLTKLKDSYRFDWRLVNILEDPQAFEQFKDEIPVVFINGRKAFKFYLDEKDFLRRIEKSQATERQIENAS